MKNHPNARLTASIVARCRNAYRAGRATQTALAERYGVTGPTMHFAIVGRTWKHVNREAKPVRVSR